MSLALGKSNAARIKHGCIGGEEWRSVWPGSGIKYRKRSQASATRINPIGLPPYFEECQDGAQSYTRIWGTLFVLSLLALAITNPRNGWQFRMDAHLYISSSIISNVCSLLRSRLLSPTVEGSD